VDFRYKIGAIPIIISILVGVGVARGLLGYWLGLQKANHADEKIVELQAELAGQTTQREIQLQNCYERISAICADLLQYSSNITLIWQVIQLPLSNRAIT